jgi:heat shock protein HslJ
MSISRQIFAVAGILFLLVGCQLANKPTNSSGPPGQLDSDPLYTAFVIGDRQVRLIDGWHEEPAAPGSAAKVTTRVWGTPVVADMNRDGIDDAMLILIQSTGGSGTFYYAAAAIATPRGYEGTAGHLLGDRIVPKGIKIVDSKARISYLAHGSGESFADDPTAPRRMDLIYMAEDRRLAEVAIDFEGEADPARMTLQMHTWTWVRTMFNDDTVKRPGKAGLFTLTFGDDGQVAGKTDCNNFHGTVAIEKHRMRLGENMAMTRRFCAGSQELEFIAMLKGVSSYFFTSRGQLILELKYDSGSMFFQ